MSARFHPVTFRHRLQSFCNLLSASPCLTRCFATSSIRAKGKDDKPKKPEQEPERERYVPSDPETADPIQCAIKVLKWDALELWDVLRGKRQNFAHQEAQVFPQFCDILIIGGGIMGSCIAYYLKQRLPKALTIVVVEKDPSYMNAASTNSFGALRTQFSQEANIKASIFGAQFLRTMNEQLSIYERQAGDCTFNHQGFLFLGTEADVAQMQINHDTQIRCGAKVALLGPAQLAHRYPWLNLDGIALGSYGLENKGWYDTWKLLYALKAKNMSFGVHYVDGEVNGFKMDESVAGHNVNAVGGTYADKLKSATVKSAHHGTQSIQFAFCVNAAGASAAEVASLSGLGIKKGVRCVPLPIEKRKRYLFSFHCPEGPKLSFPILVDPNGICVRRDGLNGMYVCSWTPKTNEEEPDPKNLDPDEQFFQDVLWPKLAFRVPVFSKLKLRGAWSTYYDYNYFDQSGVVGPHPYYGNMLFACGFSGYGIGIAPAVAKSVMDYTFEVEYQTVDMNKFEFERFLHFEPVKEIVMV